jgi:hypothetical protein
MTVRITCQPFVQVIQEGNVSDNLAIGIPLLTTSGPTTFGAMVNTVASNKMRLIKSSEVNMVAYAS